MAPPVDVNGTEKVASPWVAAAVSPGCAVAGRVSTGSTVKLQVPGARVTCIFAASTPVASPQVMA